MNNQTMFWLVSGNMTFAIQIQELLFNLPSWNAGWAWWMLGIALAQTVSVIKSCRMHREVQNHFTNVNHTLCENRGSPFRRDPCNPTPKVIMWPLWMWRIFGIIVVKSHHMSGHPKKIASFSTAFSCDNSPAIKNLKNWTTNALRSVALPLSRSEPLTPSDSRLNLETWWSGIVLGGNDVNPQLYEKNCDKHKKSLVKQLKIDHQKVLGRSIVIPRLTHIGDKNQHLSDCKKQLRSIAMLRLCGQNQGAIRGSTWTLVSKFWKLAPKAEHGWTH